MRTGTCKVQNECKTNQNHSKRRKPNKTEPKIEAKRNQQNKAKPLKQN